jgi:hypothetical protein
VKFDGDKAVLDGVSIVEVVFLYGPLLAGTETEAE